MMGEVDHFSQAAASQWDLGPVLYLQQQDDLSWRNLVKSENLDQSRVLSFVVAEEQVFCPYWSIGVKQGLKSVYGAH